MQDSRRNFLRKSALVVVGATAASVTVLASEKKETSYKADSNGVVVGTSSKKEILYTKTKAWEDYYRQAL